MAENFVLSPGNIADLFVPEVGRVTHLASYQEKYATVPSLAEELGLFQPIPSPTSTTVVEQLQGKLAVLPVTARGGAGVQVPLGKRVMHHLDIPRFEENAIIEATDVQNVSQPGAPNVAMESAIRINMLIRGMYDNYRLWKESQQMHALAGQIAYAANSVVPGGNVDLYTLFGVSQNTVNFDLTNAAVLPIEDKLAQVRLGIKAAMGQVPYTGVIGLASPTFFQKLVSHPNFKDAYKMFQKYIETTPQTLNSASHLMQVSIPGITIYEYSDLYDTGATTASWGFIDDSSDGTCLFFPVEATGRTYEVHRGPTDFADQAGVPSPEFVSVNWLDPDGRRHYKLKLQSNQLFVNLKPRAAILATGTGT